MSNTNKFIGLLLVLPAWAQTVLVSGTAEGSFEGGTGCTGNSYTVDGWTIVNGTLPNRWAVNTGAGATHGTNAIYITNNCTPNPPPHFYNINSGTVVHFYRDITIPAGQPYLSISFDLKVQGETGWDDLEVFVAPTTVNPSANSRVDAQYRVASFVMVSQNWVSRVIEPCAPYTPGNYRIIFSWRCGTQIGTQPPAALDKIEIKVDSKPFCSQLGTGVQDIGALAPGNAWNSGAGTTCGQVNDIIATEVLTCGSGNYYNGQDKVFIFTPTQDGTVDITLTPNAANPRFGLMLYGGCPRCFGCLACAQSLNGPYQISAYVEAGKPYYLVVDHEGGACAAYNNISISLTAPGTPHPACSAPPAFTTFPTSVSGDLNGAPLLRLGSTPLGCGLQAGCGDRVGHWYRFVAPGPNMYIVVTPDAPNADPAVAVYTAPSCNGPFVQVPLGQQWACNDNGCNAIPGTAKLYLTTLTAGQTYWIAVFPGATNVLGPYTLYLGHPPNNHIPAQWTGTASSDWTNVNNWHTCETPNCATDVIIPPSANSPIINAAQTAVARDLTVQAGATLTVNGTLNICGDLIVNGTLGGAGWVQFIGNNQRPTQNISGNLTGTSYIPNLRLRRSSNGIVALQTDVQTGNVDITNVVTHTLNLNGKKLYVRGNFNNAAAFNLVQTNILGSTLIFNGSGPQTYTDPGSDPLRDVIVDQSVVSTITLNNTMRIRPGGTLTLTQGIIVAPVASTREVRVENTTPAAVSPGNPNSFIAGYLRRYLNNTGGSYDFPVGLQNPQRYSRINFNFSGNPSVHNLLAVFNSWAPVLTPSGNPISECGANYSTCPMLDNGYWTVNAYQADFSTQVNTSGSYEVTLYNTGYNLCAGAQQFGVLKNNGDAATPGDWFIQNPGCHANANPAVVSRPGMSGFSHFGTGQSTQPLPVSLLDFHGRALPDGSHELSWQVDATAGSSVQRFILEAGSEPASLVPLVSLEGGVRQYRRQSPPFGRTIYRLRVVDSEGYEVQSSAIELERRPGSTRELFISLYPNPAREEVTVYWRTDAVEPMHLTMYNTLGQEMLQQILEAPATEGNVGISLQGLTAGLYLVELRQGDRLVTGRLVIE